MCWKKLLTVLVSSACLVGLTAVASSACTTVIVGKKASADGSTLVSHTCDGNDNPRMHVVAGGPQEKGAKIPVYHGASQDGMYGKVKRQVGEIPQVENTNSYFHAAYPIMNDKKIIIGEHTFFGRGEAVNSAGLMKIEQLAKLCLQRAATARECVQVMGSLAEQYGYADGGETLTIVDGNEGWVFEIVGPGPLWTPDSGTSGAAWAAVRVPDEDIYVGANRSRIGKLNLKDTANYMASASVAEVAKDMGWYDPAKDGEFVFWKAYDPVSTLGCSRREWRALTLLVPSLAGKLDPNIDPTKGEHYDFTYKVDQKHKIGVRDVMAMTRDHYEGTPYDLTVGLAAGPFANPNRYVVPATGRPEKAKDLNWERALSMFRCAYTTVGQSRADLPDYMGAVLWRGEDAPQSTVYIPYYSGMIQTAPSLHEGKFDRVDRTTTWWAFDYVGNLIDLKYSNMIKDVQVLQKQYEDQFFAQQPEIEKVALALGKDDPQKARQFLTDYTNSIVTNVTARWWQLADDLMYRYNDGYIDGQRVGYPVEWLESVGFGSTQIKK